MPWDFVVGGLMQGDFNFADEEQYRVEFGVHWHNLGAMELSTGSSPKPSS